MQESDFDETSYQAVAKYVEALCINLTCQFDRLDLVELPNEVIEWADGKKAALPEHVRITNAAAFSLGRQGT
jgi:hypothetical protein